MAEACCRRSAKPHTSPAQTRRNYAIIYEAAPPSKQGQNLPSAFLPDYRNPQPTRHKDPGVKKTASSPSSHGFRLMPWTYPCDTREYLSQEKRDAVSEREPLLTILCLQCDFSVPPQTRSILQKFMAVSRKFHQKTFHHSIIHSVSLSVSSRKNRRLHNKT